jgi:hypothetical protein
LQKKFCMQKRLCRGKLCRRISQYLTWSVWLSSESISLRKNGLVLSFPYVCPEPVLVKR